MRLLIAGISTRAAADSAARAGFDVTSIDAFADLDQHPAVRAISLGGGFTTRAAARAAREVDYEAAVYLSNFENHPMAISALATGRTLWGNPPDIVSRVRNPASVSAALQKRGIASPRVVMGHVRLKSEVRLKPDPTYEWLVKPLASGGGQRIRRWRQGEEVPANSYLQELIDGVSGSVVFAATGRHAVPLAVTLQLVGDSAFGASGYQYCGSILDTRADDAFLSRACELAHAVADEFDLVGVNGIDFVARDGVPFVVEVNPRWCASMELVERVFNLSVFAIHAAACSRRLLPDFDLAAAIRTVPTAGKAVVYSRNSVRIGDVRDWLNDPDIRDVPRSGVQIGICRPVCTIFAAGDDASRCRADLAGRAGRVYDQLARWD